MKTTIINLISADHASLKLNSFTTLHHDKVTIMNKDFDHFNTTF